MDSDCNLLFERFKCTFRQLCQPSYSIPDDSVLHLLADAIQHSVHDVASVTGTGSDEFLKNVGRTCDTLEGEVVTFSLQLAGHVGGTELMFRHFVQLLDAYFTRILGSDKWRDDVSVLTALYTSLIKVTRHQEGLYWLVRNKQDIVAKSFRLLKSGSSIFLSKSVTDFLSCLLIGTLEHDDMREIHCDTMETVRRTIHSQIQNMSDKPTNRKVSPELSSLMKLLMAVCLNDTMCDEIISEQQLVDDILKAILVTEGPVADVCLKIISNLTHRSMLDELPARLQQLIIQLCIRGNFKCGQALAVLCTDLPDDSLSRFSRALLVWPVMHVVGKPGMDDCLVQYDDILTSQMATKAMCTSALCGSLTKLDKTKVEVTKVVINLLQLTIDDQMSDEVGRQEVSGHTDFLSWLVNNRRVQQSCLQYLQGMPTSHCHELSVASAVIKIMKPSDVDPMIYTSCVRCLLPCVPTILQSCSSTLGVQLAHCLQHHLSAVQWGLRDTTLEFITDIIEKYKATPEVVEWMIKSRLHVQTWQCVDDGESYVRASAITCLSSMLHCPQVWSTSDTPELKQETVVRRMASILETDTEAFARRAAMSFIIRYHKLKYAAIPETLIAVIDDAGRTAILDFDWEVKLAALDFYKKIINSETAIYLCRKTEVPCYAKQLYGTDSIHNTSDGGNYKRFQQNVFSCVKQLTRTGCIKSLQQALDDFDQKVTEKANDMVESLHMEIKQYLEAGCPGICVKDIDWKLCCDTNGTCNSNGKTVHVEGSESNSNRLVGREKEGVGDGTILEATDVVSGLTWILHFQPETAGKEDDYKNNPLSLLEDILSYKNHNEEENVIDCY